jgi:gas vesicle protein
VWDEMNSKLIFMNAKNLIGGLLAGAAVGVAVGMLLAPNSGTKTRGRLLKDARKRTDELKSTGKYSIQSLNDGFNNGSDGFAAKSKDIF